MIANDEVKVWDPLVRVFHWALVAAFLIAYLTEDEDWLTLHVWAGYTIIGLLVFRLIWGFIGPRHARFSDFVTSPGAALGFIKDSARFKAKRYLGHNPAGGWMIILLVVLLSLIALSGVMLYGADQHAGPLAGMMAGTSGMWEDVLEEAHEVLVNMTMALIVIHVAGVVVESLMHKENLVRAMFTGRKRPLEFGEAAGPAAPTPTAPGAGVLRAWPALGAGLAVLLLLWAVPGLESSRADDDLIRGDVDSLAPLEPILAEAKARQAGRVIAVEFEQFRGKAAFEVEILDSHGRVWELMFDAKTGEFIDKVEE